MAPISLALLVLLTKAQITDRQALYSYFNVSRNFLETVNDKVERVSKADVLRVAQTHLHPDAVRILVVGNQADFDEPLAVLGPVNIVDISIPSEKAGE